MCGRPTCYNIHLNDEFWVIRVMGMRLNQLMMGVLLLAASLSGAEERSSWPLYGGIRAKSVKQLKPALASDASRPPFAGPLMYTALTITDQRSNDDDWFVSIHEGQSGNQFPGATSQVVVAILDSGAATHLVGYPDAQAMGLQGAQLTANTFGVGGVGGTIDINVSEPVGFFAHGLQHLLEASGVSLRSTTASNQSSLTSGQGNFACGVNSAFNYQAGFEVPTLLGAPFPGAFAMSIVNSQPVTRQADKLFFRLSAP